MNINSPEDAKAMIEEVKAKGPEAIERQLEKMHTDEMLMAIITGLKITIACIHAYDRFGELGLLTDAKKNLQTAIEMMSFAQHAINEDIAHAEKLQNNHT